MRIIQKPRPKPRQVNLFHRLQTLLDFALWPMNSESWLGVFSTKNLQMKDITIHQAKCSGQLLESANLKKKQESTQF